MNAIARVDGERRGGCVIAGVDGEVDASNVGWVGDSVRALVTNRSDALVLDLTATTYLDSAGIALVFALAAELRTHQQALHLVIAADSSLARLAEITGLDQTAQTYSSLAEALVT